MSQDRRESAKLMSLAVHEFRTPVSVVSGYLRLVLTHFGGSLTDMQRKLIEDGERSCGSLSRLLDELSAVARFDAGQIRVVQQRLDLVSLLERVAAGQTEGSDRGIVLALRPPGYPVHVQGDVDRLGAALATLLTATLRERAEPTTVVASCRIVTGPGAPRALVTVGDADQLDAIAATECLGESFDAYRGGLGFLPVIASRIVTAHGGWICTPEPTRGRLALLVSLPAAVDPENAS
jgi:signal transduction histidine kinase